MSTSTIERPKPSVPRQPGTPTGGRRPPGAGLSLRRTVTSEWIKFSSLRSSWVVLGTAVLGLIALAMVVAYTTGRNHVGLAPEDADLSATLQGYHLAELAAGILGVLFVTGEYATGMIRSTLAAVPKRVPVLGAKALVLGGVLWVTMTITSVVAFVSSQALLGHYGYGFSITDPSGWRVVLGTGLYLTVLGLFGSAIGWLTRSTAGGISAFVGVTLLLPVLLQLLGSWGKTAAEWLPNAAGQSFITSTHAAQTLTAGAGLAVMLAWVVAAFAAAALLLRRRDA